tara:strand:- start:404 stop:2812 length:2409 start_codon:yes stop_codon:yes gene_type:complete
MKDGFENLEDDILFSLLPGSQEQGSYEEDLINKIAQERLLASIDTKTGAPANVRASVSAAQSQDDRLATLRNFYPDAVPVQAIDPENGVAKFGFGNFVYTNPETGQLTLFDEDLRLFGVPVPGLRDFVDVGPEIAETAGAIGGAIGGATIGAPAGPGGIAAGVVVGEGLGSAAAREAYIGILDFFGETEDNRSGADRLFDFGTTTAINAVGGPVVNKVVQGVKYVAGQPIRYAMGGMSKDSATALKNMEIVGITEPSAGMVTANPTINLMEQALAAAPTSTKIMHENAAQVINQMDNFSRELAEKYGGVRTTSEAAEELMDGARKARVRYDNKVDSLYREVDEFMPNNLVSEAEGTVEFINKYLAQSTTATGADTVNPALRMAEKVVKDAKDGVLTYNQLKSFRSSLMHNLRSAQAAGAKLDAPGQKIKELVGYVTKDIDALVARSDNPMALEKYKAANAFVKANTGKAGGLTYLDNVINKGAARTTDALNYVLRGAKDGGEDLLKLRQMMNPDEYNVISGYMLGRMGLPTPGMAGVAELGESAIKEGSEYIAEQGFSPRTFITNWNRLSKEAKEALFKNTEHADLVPELDALVTTIDRIGKSADQMANPSGTARVMGALGIFGIGAADVGLGSVVGSEGFEYGLSALVAPYMSANLLTNKQFVGWLTEGVEKAAYDPQSWGQHVRRLYQIYELNPDIREEVRAITEGLTGDTIERIPSQNSKSTPSVTTPAPNEQAFREVTNPEIAGKLLPDTNLAEQITDFTMPTVEDPDRQLAMSPTIVPDERDREIAMRGAGGIGSLV